ncbi:lytic transglycosylase domain-containing protein [Sediminicurvatus halobius]|uniref:Lytic transglycosylase n=1 Tax=Sediminicurvatus halobius TaxID=2182432 RepID=A0A2U2N674_9GAMM|nr:lytic transglycosylase domain-containing protein [Spiribacter halobius]PWG64578.1 lytic transglycosylase [Spiribacter halobius]UEX79102.1 LysM peptidoglycan-binding domain-containing protein [Spiribacter halobius]
MLNTGRWLLAAALMAMAGLAVAGGERLPRPEPLEPAVGFWKRIYTEVPDDRGLIHDAEVLSRVFGEVAVAPPGEWVERRARVRAALDRYRAALEALAAEGEGTANPLARRLAGAFAPDTPAEEILAAAERLRFQGGLADRFREGIVRSGRWRDYIRAQLAARGVPPELVALPHVESSFNPVAASHAGASGLWQFTRGTGLHYLRIDTAADERLDPWRSTEAAAALLADNYAELGHWPLAITAYNHGVNGMRRAVERTGSTDLGRIVHEYEGPRFGFASRNFYAALLAAADVDAEPERYFGPVTREPALEHPEVTLRHYLPASTLARHLDVPLGDLQRLNPALRATVWEGSKFVPAGYRLRLPAGAGEALVQAIQGIPAVERYAVQRPDREHRIASGETLSGIAARYGVSTRELAAANGLGNGHLIRAGQRLRLPGAGPEPTPIGGRVYRVQRGDTLAGIARRHGMDGAEVARINGLGNPDLIRVGQTLLLSQPHEVAAADALPGEG